MIKHGEHVVEYVDDFLHELLSEADGRYVSEHCRQCAICRTAMGQARRRLGLLRSMPALEPSGELLRRTVDQVMDASRRKTRGQIAWRVFVVAIAAAVLITGSLHLYFLNLTPSPYDLNVVVQSEMMPDTQASLRAVVLRRDGGAAVKGTPVRIELVDAKTARRVELANFSTDGNGSGEPRFRLPDWSDGDYELRVTAEPGAGDEVISHTIKLHRNWKLMLSCDKPVYQPGQVMHFRALALRRPDLIPVAGQEAIFSVTDPKGNVVFKATSVTSKYGITSADCPLAEEIMEGPYAIECRIGETQSRQTVEIKKYVLPKFGVDVQTDKSYYSPGARMRATIHAAYFFGKPVAQGMVRVAIRDGATEEEQSLATDADGNAQLEWPIAEKLIGRPEDGGDGRISLDVRVTDSAGQEQERTISRVVAANPLRVEVIPESGTLVENMSNTLYVLTTYADGAPAETRVIVSGFSDELQTDKLGAVSLSMTPRSPSVTFTVRAVDSQGLSCARQVTLECGQTEGNFVLRTDKAVYRGGETVRLAALGGGDEPVFIDMVKDGQTLLTATVVMAQGHGDYQVDLPPDVFGTLELNGYRLGEDAIDVRKSRLIYVQPAQQLKLAVAQDKPEYRPGEKAMLSFAVTDAAGRPTPGAISLAAVDEAVFSVLDQAPGMEETFFTLEQEMLKPIYAIYNWSGVEARGPTRPPVVLEQALFSHAQEMRPDSRTSARDRLAKAVAEGDVDPRALEALDRPDAQKLLNEWDFEEPTRSLLEQAIAEGPAIESTYPRKLEHIEQLRKVGLEAAQEAWDALWIVAAIAGLVRLSQALGGPGLGKIVAFLIVAALIVSTLLPSLNRARETANRVKAANNLKQLAIALDLEGEPRLAKQAEAGAPAGPRLRQWFPETLLWRPELITDDQGRANLDLDLADSITTWRLSASAVSAKGQLGAAQAGIRVFQPFFVDLNLPVALTRNDEITLPVSVYSYINRVQSVELKLDTSADWFELLDEPVKQITLQAGDVRGVTYRLRVKRVGMHDLRITASGEGVSDAVKRTIEVLADGRMVEQVANGTLQKPANRNLMLPGDAIDGSGKLLVKIYPSTFSQLVEGLDGIFQRPYGCFEQTSSTTYPNLLALDYLKQTHKDAPEVEAKAREYIQLGYQRLVGFEVPGGGFDWFGRSPANLVLSAYGLMEFEDMRKVFEVDPNLIDRTRRWLLSKRNGDGSWSSQSMLEDGLAQSVLRGGNPNLATTAYVAWAVFGSGEGGEEAAATLDYLQQQQVDKIDDPYVLAVLTNCLVAMDPNGAQTYAALDRLAGMRQVSEDGKQAWWSQSAGGQTAFYGNGQAGSIETTAMAALALMRGGRDSQITRGALSWLIGQKDSSGTWPSTQATVLSLKALVAATGKPVGGQGERLIHLALGDGFTQEIRIAADQAEVMQQVDLSEHLHAGANTLSLDEATGGESGYQVAFRYNTPSAPAVSDEPLAITMDYDRTDLSIGQTMTATATLSNRTQAVEPMVLVDLPIPAGFQVEAEEFENLVQSGSIAKYQLTPRSVIVYLRSLAAQKAMEIRYRLNATMAVKITAPAAQAYEYYNPARRCESGPRAISVKPA